MKKYEVQTIKSDRDGLNYRITEISTDSRVATCYQKENAELVCNALNAYGKDVVETNAVHDYYKQFGGTCFDPENIKKKQDSCPHPSVRTYGGIDICDLCQKQF